MSIELAYKESKSIRKGAKSIRMFKRDLKECGRDRKDRDINEVLAEFIGPDEYAWKVDMIDEVFNAKETDFIKGLPLCRVEVEDKLVWHFQHSEKYSIKSVCECAASRNVWLILNFAWDDGRTDSSWILDKLQRLERVHFQQLIFSIWFLWCERNKELHGYLYKPPHIKADRIIGLILEYQAVMQKLNATLSCHAIMWIKPSQGLVKVNFDADFDRHCKISGVGVIARDVEVFVLVAKAQQLDRVTQILFW
ncbi:hypothetical protein PTKIN_Ptkin06aG0012400 [Pterospermum kingtungense]